MLQDITRQISTINKLCHNYLKMCDIYTLIMLQQLTELPITILHIVVKLHGLFGKFMQKFSINEH